MQLLIKGQMYYLIQDLVNGHALLKIDASSLDADELLSVQRIKEKNNRDNSQNDSGDGDQSQFAGNQGGKGKDQQYEGGFAENADINDGRGAAGEVGAHGVANKRQRSYNRTPLINDL